MTEHAARASKKQQELLSFVDGFIKGNGYGPSYREIMRALGYKSVSTVAIHIDGLIAKGYLRRADKSARSLEVVTMRDTAHRPQTDEQGLLEEELLRRVEATKLTDDDTDKVHEALQLLGFDGLVEKLVEKSETDV